MNQRSNSSSDPSAARPASAHPREDASTAVGRPTTPARAPGRGVCKLSRVRMRKNATRGSTLSSDAQTQPSPRRGCGKAPRMRRPSVRSACPSTQRPSAALSWLEVSFMETRIPAWLSASLCSTAGL